MYTAWCDDDGKVIDDGTLARIGDDFFRLTAAIPTLYWLQDNAAGLDVEIEDASDASGALSLQGPTSRDLLQSICDADLGSLRYFRLVETKVAGVAARVSRTGYTGDLGYEIFVDPGDAERLWDATLDTGRAYGLQAAGNLALDMVRIEAGLLLIDVDFVSARQTLFEVQRSSPYELGLGWMVKLTKDFFVGREALRQEQARGPAWTTVGIVVDVDLRPLPHAAAPALHVVEHGRSGVRGHGPTAPRRQGDQRHLVSDPEELRGHLSRRAELWRAGSAGLSGRDGGGSALRHSREDRRDAVLRSAAQEGPSGQHRNLIPTGVRA
jgi:aminomethyltransferase